MINKIKKNKFLKAGWKGTLGENGEIVQDGTYTWKIEFMAKSSPKIKVVIGHVNLLRQKFNINIFLNEKCKDAITMTDFIKSIEISISNLLITKDKGLTDGITNIFVENMNKLPIYKRPLHCTDIKRETLYIKNDKWEKDDYKVKIKEAIKNVSILQTKNIKKYKESKPNCMSNDKEREEYLSIIKNTTDKIDGNDDKIINNLCKNVYINDKTTIE